MVITELVGYNFSRFPEYYSIHASTQKKVADCLASAVSGMISNSQPLRAMEIGCGTGFLTEKILKNMLLSELLVTDISPVMLEYCSRKILSSPEFADSAKIEFQLHDISKGSPGADFDIILSSLVFQWVENLTELMNTLYSSLAENGMLIFSTLLEGTFANIADIFAAEGIHFPMPILPNIDKIRESASLFSKVEIIEESYNECHTSMKAFLDHLHHIGAGNATGERIPTSKLRAIIRAEERFGEVTAEYKVAYVVCSR